MTDDKVVKLKFPGAAPEVSEVIEDAIKSNPNATDVVIILFDVNDDGAMTLRCYASRQQMAMAGARLLWLAGCNAADDPE